jgi:putative two-component system response regulator
MEPVRKKIILVDDMLTNLRIGREVLSGIYDVFTVPSAEKLFRMLEKTTPDLILLDIDMPGMNGYEAIKFLKADEQTRGIPVIFLSANGNHDCESKGLSLGAVDFVTKPYCPQILLNRVGTQLRLESQHRLIREYEAQLRLVETEKVKALAELQRKVMKIVTELVGRRDEVTGGHMELTHRYVEVLLDVLIKNDIYHDIVQSWEKDFLLQSTLLYDLGKVSINDRILLKPGRLTDEEFTEMQKHTLMGVKILEAIEAELEGNSTEISFLDHAKAFAGCHHERWDGSGYPYGLKGYNIPLQGRIMAIVDVYTALVTERPYKRACTHDEAMQIIACGKGSNFDPALVDLFLSASGRLQQVSVVNTTFADSVSS